jgi:neutral ceramidase
MPNKDEVAAAKEVMARLGDHKPKTIQEVYARETVLLDQMPSTRELVLQAIRVGDLGIAALPNETFGSSGLTIKQKSPLRPTFTIDLANGYLGYIPPPEVYKLGGYTSWRARTSCLEIEAEPKIVSTVLTLLNNVAQKQRE